MDTIFIVPSWLLITSVALALTRKYKRIYIYIYISVHTVESPLLPLALWDIANSTVGTRTKRDSNPDPLHEILDAQAVQWLGEGVGWILLTRQLGDLELPFPHLLLNPQITRR